MTEFDEIDSLKDGEEKSNKFKEYYSEKVKIEDWMNNPYNNWIIRYKNKTIYKKNGQYHRLNGPAIEYIADSTGKVQESEYYYKGKKYEYEEWKKITTKELRRIKIKKLNKNK